MINQKIIIPVFKFVSLSQQSIVVQPRQFGIIWFDGQDPFQYFPPLQQEQVRGNYGQD